MAESNEATHFAMIARLATHGAIIVPTECRAHLRALLASLDRFTCLVHCLSQSQFSVDLVDHILVDLVLLDDLVQVSLLVSNLLLLSNVALFVSLAETITGTC